MVAPLEFPVAFFLKGMKGVIPSYKTICDTCSGKYRFPRVRR